MFQHAKGPSQWHYQTSQAANVGVEIIPGVSVTRNVGTLTLKDPSGNLVVFNVSMRGVSAGYSGLKKLNLGPTTGGGSLNQMWSSGVGDNDILVAEGCPANELSFWDFEGFCIVEEISAAFGFGSSWTLWLMGIPLTRVPLAILSETGLLGAIPDLEGGSQWLDVVGGPLGGWLAKKAIRAGHTAPKAIVRAVGTSAGWQAGISGSQAVGLVTIPPVRVDIPKITVRPPREHVSIRSRSAQNVELTIMGDVLFNFDDDHFKIEATKPPPPTAKEKFDCIVALNAIMNTILAKPPRSIEVWGYTDSFHPEWDHNGSYNRELSYRRANRMRRWINHFTGLRRDKIHSHGAGASEFVVSPFGTKEQQQANRRVVLYLIFG
jgi:outer membrane protein OmpA-like peptidoglycan-associated protein